MHFPTTIFLSFLLLDIQSILGQSSPTSEKPNTASAINKCPVLKTAPQGRNLLVDLLPNNQCQLVISISSQNMALDRVVRLVPRTIRKEVRQIHFIEALFRRPAAVPQLRGLSPINCSPLNVQVQSNTIIIETRPRDCYVTIAHKEVLTPEWNAARRIPIFTNKESYEVKTSGPFQTNLNFPVVPRPGVPSNTQPVIPGLGQSVPQVPATNPQLGVQMFSPLVFPNVQVTGAQAPQNRGIMTATAGGPPPVPASLTDAKSGPQ